MDGTISTNTAASRDAAHPGAAFGLGDSAPVVALEGTLDFLLDSLSAAERMLAAASAVRAALVDQARQVTEALEHARGERLSGSNATAGPAWSIAERARRCIAAEIACAIRLPEFSVNQMLTESQSLMHELPETMAALRTGAITYRHAQKIIEHANSLPEEARGQFERDLVPYARTHTVAHLHRKARAIRERRHPESIAVRHRQARDSRRVFVEPARDGMSYLTFFMPAATAAAAHDRLTADAEAFRRAGDPRTLDQLRTDLGSNLLIAGTSPALDDGSVALGTRAQVSITVPVFTLLGLSDEPAELDGYGPIDPDTAREITRTATSFTRILTHPHTGAVLSVSKQQFAVPADLKRWLRVRDGTCRFMGCSQPARRCDLDHTVDRQYGGSSSHDNLAHLCRAHHRLKHETDWLVRSAGNGVFSWTSPTGRSYSSDPTTVLRV
ncbi:HNH endonuclease [Marisediminicola senii]|uniref:HNH endonuclease n=1 Tax=Marisediminicola senii TaxID=2711233 RepID=UPI0013EC7422|nr:HNH endonuclease signature motif containing protein [Marisediminicola senii]